jgi:HlyD family secretion protein
MKKKKKVVIGVALGVFVTAAAATGIAIKYVKDGSILPTGGQKVEGSVYVDSVEKIMDPAVGGVIQRYSGVIEPQKTWKIETSDKKVKEIYVEEGDEVKAGQDLFIYDTAEAEESLIEAEIEKDRLSSEIETAKARIESLTAERAKVTGEDERLEYTNLIQTQENSLKRSEYDLQKQTVTIEQLKKSIANATVQSEMDGIVKSINENPNENSYSGDEESNAFMTILAKGSYRVKGTVNEQNRNSIMEGLPVIVHSRVDENITWNGTMGSLDTENTASNGNEMYYGMNSGNDTSSSNYNFYVDLETSEGLILGQHVFIEIDNGQNKHPDGVWLGSYYIVQDDSGAYVWAADSRDCMEKRTVTLGEFDEELNQYEIKEGLTEEDYIAFPSDEIQAGMKAERNLENATVGIGASGESGYEGDVQAYPEDEGIAEDEYLDEGISEEEYLDEGISEEEYLDEGISEEEYPDEGTDEETGQNILLGEEEQQ